MIGLADVESIPGGAFHSLPVPESGRVRSCGYNLYGELGNGASGSGTEIPVAVKNLSNVISIDGGEELTLATTQ